METAVPALLASAVVGWLTVTGVKLHRARRRLLEARALLERQIRTRDAAPPGGAEREAFRVAVLSRRCEAQTCRWRRRARRIPAWFLEPLIRIDEAEPIALDLPPEPRRLPL